MAVCLDDKVHEHPSLTNHVQQFEQMKSCTNESLQLSFVIFVTLWLKTLCQRSRFQFQRNGSSIFSSSLALAKLVEDKTLTGLTLQHCPLLDVKAKIQIILDGGGGKRPQLYSLYMPFPITSIYITILLVLLYQRYL